MFESQITKIFESTTVSEYLSLKRVELDDKTFMKLLGLKPGEINIIMARTSSFIKNDGKDKSRKDLVNDILEVLERSSVARTFVGVGLNEEYNLFKGFPVRNGDPYYPLPEISHELVLQPPEVIIGWNTDATKARELGVKYDASKGEAAGGLLVETHVDSTKILFDVNAVLRVCKMKMNLINQYNQQCAPGKAISKVNTDFLATEAPDYHGELEIITSNKIVNCRVVDKWSWDNSSGTKVVKWVGAEKPSANQEQPQNPQTNIREMFKEAELHEMPTPVLAIDAYHMDEGFRDNFKKVGNWISKTAAITLRGKTLKYLETLMKQYQTQKEVYKLAAEYASKIDQDDSRIRYAQNQMAEIDKFIADVQEALGKIQQNPNVALSLAKPEEMKESPIKSSLEDIFTESTFGIFDHIADASMQVKDKVTRKQLEKIFNKLVKTLDTHYAYRLKALEQQKDILETDYNSYKGSRFENLPSVQHLKQMVDATNQSIKAVQEIQSEFNKNKRDAFNFAFSGSPAPQQAPQDAAKAQELDKKEDTIDKVEDLVVNKVADAAEAPPTAEKEPVAEPEKPQEPVTLFPDEIEPVEPEVAPKAPETEPKPQPILKAAKIKKAPISMEAKIEQDLKNLGYVSFKGSKAAEAFKKTHPDWKVERGDKEFKFVPPSAENKPTEVSPQEPPKAPEAIKPEPTETPKEVKPVDFSKLLYRDTFQNYMSNYEQKKNAEKEIADLKAKAATIPAGSTALQKKIANAENELKQINTRLSIIPQDVPDDQLEDAFKFYKNWEAEKQNANKPVEPAPQPIQAPPVQQSAPETAEEPESVPGVREIDRNRERKLERAEKIAELKGQIVITDPAIAREFEKNHPDWKKETLGNQTKYSRPTKAAE